MRMKPVSIGILLLSSGLAFAEVDTKSMFTCIDLKNYDVNSQCASSLISSKTQFQNMQKEFETKLALQSPNVMATTQFFPNKMLIKVIAQKEQNSEENELLASVK